VRQRTAAFHNAKARFAGVTTLEREELIGYRMWREAKGGKFEEL
jgi:hypothetical protein